NLSRDMWSRVVYGARVSVTVGVATIALATVLATVVGVSSGYFGGTYDLVVQRVVDAWLSFPYLVIILSVMAVLGPGLLNLVVALTILSAAVNSRVIRGATIAVAQSTYVEAARALGCGHARIITRHILPNVTATVIILATIGLGAVTLAESALSFLGFGVPPPTPRGGVTPPVLRGATSAAPQPPSVGAARAPAGGHARIITRHILPNVTATVIILATIGLGAVTLAESALSFLGFGVPPPFPSWGAMLSGSGRTYMFRAPWMAVWPGVAISLAVFGFNMLGDALRDVLDPRLRGATR